MYLKHFNSAVGSNALIKIWAVLIFIGQGIFAAYILVQFVIPFISDSLPGNSFVGLFVGYIEGDVVGNNILLLHILPVMLLSLSGILQLIPYVRLQVPVFHRWNGRFFLLFGIIGALTGLWLTWARETRLSEVGSFGITLNGLLIPVAVILAWYFARKKSFMMHKRWAIHSFILINGVWSFRLMLTGWFLINQGPNGNNENLDGPADIFFSYACYLLPMLIIEIYWWAKKRKAWFTLNVTLILTICLTFIGVIAATMMMWWPKISVAF